VHNTSPLHTFQSGFDDLELRAVDHDRNPGDVWFALNEIEKGRHRLHSVEEGVVHVYIEHLSAILYLLPCHAQCFLVFIVANESCEFLRTSYVCSLANINEVRFGSYNKGLQS